MAATDDEPRWKYVLTAMDGSTPQGAGEVFNPHQRTYSDPLNGMRQASFAIDMDNPRANWITNNDALGKVYRRNRNDGWDHLLTGDVLSTEESDDGSTGQIICTIVDPWFRLTRRTIGMYIDGSTGQAHGFFPGASPTTQVDLSLAIKNILATVNFDFYCGVDLGSYGTTGTLSIVGPIFGDFAGPNIKTICAMLGGPDVWIDPVEPSGVMPNTHIGNMNIAFARGTTRPLAIFEFGTGRRNVQSYKRLRTKQNAANFVSATPPGWPTGIATGDAIAQYGDTTSQQQIGMFEDIAGGDVTSLQLRQILCQEEVNVRKQAQQQITFVPTVDNPLDYKVDYDVGDVVTARAYDAGSDSWRFDGTVRVYGVGITVNDEDEEAVSLTLIPGG